MRVRPRTAALAALLIAMAASPSPARDLRYNGLPIEFAQASPAAPAKSGLPVFQIPPTGVTFQTGDTWEQSGKTFRLYGVQSCIRGTTFTSVAGKKTDCGEASLAFFAAIIRDTKPRCTAVAQAGSPPVIYSVCAARIGATTLDLGTMLITQGFAFAAVDASGRPVNVQYFAAEGDAHTNKRGLWAASDLPYPNTILSRAAGGGRP